MQISKVLKKFILQINAILELILSKLNLLDLCTWIVDKTNYFLMKQNLDWTGIENKFEVCLSWVKHAWLISCLIEQIVNSCILKHLF